MRVRVSNSGSGSSPKFFAAAKHREFNARSKLAHAEPVVATSTVSVHQNAHSYNNAASKAQQRRSIGFVWRRGVSGAAATPESPPHGSVNAIITNAFVDVENGAVPTGLPATTELGAESRR